MRKVQQTVKLKGIKKRKENKKLKKKDFRKDKPKLKQIALDYENSHSKRAGANTISSQLNFDNCPPPTHKRIDAIQMVWWTSWYWVVTGYLRCSNYKNNKFDRCCCCLAGGISCPTVIDISIFVTKTKYIKMRKKQQPAFLNDSRKCLEMTRTTTTKSIFCALLLMPHEDVSSVHYS